MAGSAGWDSSRVTAYSERIPLDCPLHSQTDPQRTDLHQPRENPIEVSWIASCRTLMQGPVMNANTICCLTALAASLAPPTAAGSSPANVPSAASTSGFKITYSLKNRCHGTLWNGGVEDASRVRSVQGWHLHDADRLRPPNLWDRGQAQSRRPAVRCGAFLCEPHPSCGSQRKRRATHEEAFLKIHDGIGSLKDDQRLTAWLYRIARNAITDHFRKYSSRQ